MASPGQQLDGPSFRQDFPSFQEHDVFPAPEDQVHVLDGELFDKTRNVSDHSITEEKGDVRDIGADHSDLEDLPASGFV
jgi:hypothetical protein